MLDEDGLSLKKILKMNRYTLEKRTPTMISIEQRKTPFKMIQLVPNISDNQTHSDASTDVSNTRKQRIWDYIEKDKQREALIMTYSKRD